MTPSALSQIETGETKEISARNLLGLAKALRVSAEQLHDGGDDAGFGPGRYVRIVGFAIANPDEDGFFEEMGGDGLGYIDYDTSDADAYALRVKGDSMVPRIRHGEYIVVLPNAAYNPEDDVLVKLKNGRKMVKQLIAQRKDEYTFGSVNQDYGHRTISVEEIEAVHKVDCIKGRSTNVRE